LVREKEIRERDREGTVGEGHRGKGNTSLKRKDTKESQKNLGTHRKGAISKKNGSPHIKGIEREKV